MILIIKSTHSLSTILTDRSSGWWATQWVTVQFISILTHSLSEWLEHNSYTVMTMNTIDSKEKHSWYEHSSDLTDQLSLHHHHSSLSTQWSDLNNPSLLLISFHCSGWDWGWVWTWTIRVAIQISYASGAVVCEVHVTSQPSEFDPDGLSSFFSFPFHLLHKSVVSVMALWSLYHQHLW